MRTESVNGDDRLYKAMERKGINAGQPKNPKKRLVKLFQFRGSDQGFQDRSRCARTDGWIDYEQLISVCEKPTSF